MVFVVAGRVRANFPSIFPFVQRPPGFQFQRCGKHVTGKPMYITPGYNPFWNGVHSAGDRSVHTKFLAEAS